MSTPSSTAPAELDTVPSDSIEPSVDGLARLRSEWRAAALDDWLRGPRLLALIVGAIAVPALTYYVEHADGKTGWLGDMVTTMSLVLLAPAILVATTLASLDGPRGMARMTDLRTVEGGSAEWFLALMYSARVASFLVFAVWACLFPMLQFEGGTFGTTLLVLLSLQIPLWTIPWIVAACRLRIKSTVVGSLCAWGLSMWPGGMILLSAGDSGSCGTSLGGAVIVAVPIGYLFQGAVAWSTMRLALDKLAATPE